MGTRVTPDLKIRLGNQMEKRLQLIPFEGKEYVGAYLETPLPTIAELQNHCREFMATLQKLLPDLRTDNFPIVVFPQLFLG
jgi:hypothetical protein